MGRTALLMGLVLVVIVGLYVGYNMALEGQKESCGPGASPSHATGIAPAAGGQADNNATGTSLEELAENPAENPTKNYSGEGDASGTAGEGENGKTAGHDSAGELAGEGSGHNGNPPVLLFWSKGCRDCAAEGGFIDEMEHKYPELEIRRYEVSEDDKNTQLMIQTCAEYNLSCGSVPITIVGNIPFVKFKDYAGRMIMYGKEGGYVGYSNQIEEAMREVAGLGEMNTSAPVLRAGDEAGLGEMRSHTAMNVTTDKAVYYDGESIWILAIIMSDWNITGCKLVAQGIDGRLDASERVGLGAGQNRFLFRAKAPNCFGCANFQPGEYPIDVLLECAGEPIYDKTLTIEIRDRG